MTLIKNLLTVGILVGGISTATADTISGSIGFTGAFSSDTGNINTADVLYFSGPNYTGPAGSLAKTTGVSTGAYASVPDGTLGGWTQITIDPITSATPIWSFSVGTVDYWFDLTTFSVNQSIPNVLLINGTGIAYIDDGAGTYEPTSGDFNFTANQDTRKVNFNFSISQNVPDGGTTAILLGVGLLGLGALRRKA